nr:MAG TPA_asm: Stimulus-sensing domain [Caudoviricetes sp.]
MSSFVYCSKFLVPMRVVIYGTNGKALFDSRIFWYQ